jgi:Zinc-binding dehydrogenase
VRARANLWPYSASAAWAISAFSSPRNRGSGRSRSRAARTRSLARELGARHYIDSQAQDPAAELRTLGGAKVILATVTNGDAMAAVVCGLGADGSLMVIGAEPSLTVAPGQLIGGRLAVKGWYSGTSIDSQDTLAFCALTGVRSMNETFPLERVADAYERMLSGQARFRVVLTISNSQVGRLPEASFVACRTGSLAPSRRAPRPASPRLPPTASSNRECRYP